MYQYIKNFYCGLRTCIHNEVNLYYFIYNARVGKEI